MPLDKEQIEHNFTYHKPPSEKEIENYQIIREKGKALALFLNENCPPSRELSLALTKLEETVMWANASIARS